MVCQSQVWAYSAYLLLSLVVIFWPVFFAPLCAVHSMLIYRLPSLPGPSTYPKPNMNNIPTTLPLAPVHPQSCYLPERPPRRSLAELYPIPTDLLPSHFYVPFEHSLPNQFLCPHIQTTSSTPGHMRAQIPIDYVVMCSESE